jgi:hypothetical protein
VTPAIVDVVQSGLAKDPADRPANARELAERYEAALAADAVALAPTSPSKAGNLQPRPTMRGKRLPAPPVQQQTQQPPQPPVRSGPVRTITAAAAVDPGAVVHKIEAWMPERIAAYKLHGFIQDTGGEVLESVPGRIRVRLGGKGSAYLAPRRNGFNWLGLGRGSGLFELELHLQRPVGGRENQLNVTVVVRSPSSDLNGDISWTDVCGRIFCDLRAYLMGQSGAVSVDNAV